MKLNRLIVCFIVSLGDCSKENQTPFPCIDLEDCLLATGYIIASTVVCPDGSHLNDKAFRSGRKCSSAPPPLPLHRVYTTPSTTTTVSKRDILKKMHQQPLKSFFREISPNQRDELRELAKYQVTNPGDRIGVAVKGRITKNAGLGDLLQEFVPKMELLSLFQKKQNAALKNRYPRNAESSINQLLYNPEYAFLAQEKTKKIDKSSEDLKFDLSYRSSKENEDRLYMIQSQALESFLRKLDKDNRDKIMEAAGNNTMVVDFQGDKVKGKVPKYRGIGEKLRHFVPGLDLLSEYTERKKKSDEIRQKGNRLKREANPFVLDRLEHRLRRWHDNNFQNESMEQRTNNSWLVTERIKPMGFIKKLRKRISN